MTDTNTQLPKALQLAAMFDHPSPPDWREMQAAAAELRHLDAREDELLHHVCVLQGMNDESLESIRALTAELEQARAALAAQNEREANATARAFSLATMAAEEFVRCNGLSTGEADEFLMTGADLTDEYATACIEHLKHVGECVAFDCDDGVIVRLGDFTLGSLS